MTVRTRAQLNADAETYLADNAGGDITEADVRQRVKDLADSAVMAEDGPVLSTRVVSAGSGLAGGGDLSTNRELALSAPALASLAKADSAAQLNTAQTWTGAQQFGQLTGTVTAVAALQLDCALSNEFTKTIASNSTFTVTNVPASKAFHLRLLLTYTSGTITWFSGVQWVKGTAPAFTGGKVYEVILTTQNGGTTWRGAAGEYNA